MNLNPNSRMISRKIGLLFLILFSPILWTNLNAQIIPDGVYFIQSSINSDYCIDNSSSLVQNGNNIHIYKKNFTDAQKWKVENRNGHIIIRSMNNPNYVLDNSSSMIQNGNNIHLWEYNGTNAQLWHPDKVGENTYVLRSALNNSFVVDLNNSATVNGNNIHLWENNGTKAQNWVFVRVNTSNGNSTNYYGTPTYPSFPSYTTPNSDYDRHKATCSGCTGSGRCRHCNGSGYVNNYKSKCSLCHGSGRCASCHGKGFIRGNF